MKNFKHLLIIALVAVFAVGQANAEFRFGVKAGANFNKINFSGENWKENFSASNHAGVTAGVMTEFTVPIIGIGVDLSLMYSHMKNEFKQDGTDKGAGKNFLEIPLNLKYKLNLPIVNNIIRPMVFTGPTFAFKLNKDILQNMKTKTCQLGWNFGLGLEFVKHVQISGYYTLGMNKIAEVPFINQLTQAENLVKIKNNYWTVTAAYLF